jgi:hypothetical protein
MEPLLDELVVVVVSLFLLSTIKDATETPAGNAKFVQHLELFREPPNTLFEPVFKSVRMI